MDLQEEIRGSSTTPPHNSMDLQSDYHSLSQVILQIVETEDHAAAAPTSTSTFTSHLSQVSQDTLLQNLNEFDAEEATLGSGPGPSTTPTTDPAHTLVQDGNKRRLVEGGTPLSCPTHVGNESTSDSEDSNSMYNSHPPIKYKEWSVDSVKWAEAYLHVVSKGELVLGAGCLLEGLFSSHEIIGSTIKGKKGTQQLCQERQAGILKMLGWMRGTGKGYRYPYNFTQDDPIDCPLTEEEEGLIRKKVFIEKRSQLSIKLRDKVKKEIESAAATPATPELKEGEEETAEDSDTSRSNAKTTTYQIYLESYDKDAILCSVTDVGNDDCEADGDANTDATKTDHDCVPEFDFDEAYLD